MTQVLGAQHVGAAAGVAALPLVPELATAFHHAPVGMAVLSTDGRVFAVNPVLAALLRRPQTELVGARLDDLAADGDAPAVHAHRWRQVEARTPHSSLEVALVRGDGEPVPVLLSQSLVSDRSGRPVHLVCHLQDLSSFRAAQAQLAHLALHDPLTGLPNRVLFTDRLAQALTGTRRSPASVAVVFCDLDGFKSVNDTHGHAAGDAVLVAFARRLQHAQRAGDTAARLGGDEFVVLCDSSGLEEASSLADRIRGMVRRPFRVESLSIRLGVSIGVAASERGSATPESLLHAADVAMLRAKRARSSDHGPRRRPTTARPGLRRHVG